MIAGLFVLAEDQYGVGDSVDLGLATGEVERITLRSVRLRDGEGRVWHVAHGNVMCVANLSKSSTALLDLELSRDSDLGVVEEVVGRLAGSTARASRRLVRRMTATSQSSESPSCATTGWSIGSLLRRCQDGATRCVVPGAGSRCEAFREGELARTTRPADGGTSSPPRRLPRTEPSDSE